MVNKALRIVLYSIFTISLLFVVPFNNIYADTLSTSQITYNVYLQDVVDSSNTTLVSKDYIYDIDFNFDKSYLGWVSVQMIISYTHAIGDTRQLTLNRALYLNGSNVHTSVVISSNFNGINGGPFLSMSISVNNSNVTPMADLSSLQDIIDLLQDIDDHVSIDILDELQNIVANTSLANNYLETISKLRQWHPYTESIPFIITLFRKGYQTIDIDLNNSAYTNYIDYPIFTIPSGSIIEERTMYTTSTQNEYYIVFGTNENINNVTNFNTYFDFQIVDGNFEYSTSSIIVNSGFRIIKLSIKCTSNGTFRFKAKNSTRYVMPIVSVRKDQMHFSTDFALLFQFSNPLLDNIQIIANGTNESSAASSQSDQANSQLQQDSNTLFSQEDTFKQNMNSAMQNIDTTFTLNNFGQSFMTSAQWVRTQYETLTNNTPFASLITFSLLVGLALIVIGKVYK